jgi:taurine dioxygenase
MGTLRTFSERFGDIQGPSAATPDVAKDVYAHVGTLSNLKEDGKYIGLPDAGQDWHTDMSYRDVMGFVNVLYGIRIPRRNGVPLGGTEFSNMHAVYEALPADIRTRLADATTTHNFEKFWEHMRRDKASTRPPMTETQRRNRPPVTHPLFLTHPITGRKVLYCNPGYTTRINELSERESDEMLEYLFDFQLEQRFRYTHSWTENDLLVWDHLGTIHRAIADYGADEIRLMRRCQVMATKVFDPEFLRPVRELSSVEA